MSQLRTLVKIVQVLIKNPYALKRVLDEPVAPKPLSHDEIYDDGYFQFVEQTSTPSAAVIAKAIVSAFHPCLLVDVGCGTGVLLERLREQGVQVKGLEYAGAALKRCQMRNLDVRKFDVTNDELPSEFTGADVVVSLEVGQQLSEAKADRYIDLLCQVAPIVVFSSATPGQGDRRPVNEKPHEYWIEKFGQRGFRFDRPLSLQWRHDWQVQDIAPWFYRNVMIFQRDQATWSGTARPYATATD